MNRPQTVEECRQFWMNVGKRNGWYQEGQSLYVQVWLDEDGGIEDAVSYQSLTEDIIIPYAGEDDEEGEE